ncbi:lysozyme [Nocardia sp. GAS34]|uniref:GH25 family lysozyme n=1 Tax=unclassified Nocardia TaxID=2637762 RepID=UPI003D190194
MTLYGIDISNYQANINLGEVAKEGFSWVEAKVSEGNYYKDPTWAANQSAAAQAGIAIIGYHYANASDSPASQVQNWQANGGPNVCMIDFEANSGNINDYWALVNAFNAAGVTVALSYIPQWYWSQIGSPDLSKVPGLVSSAYPGGTGYASQIYANAGGDSGEGWASYGGGNPVIWQFTDQASVAGMTVDADAFRGSAADLATLLGGQGTGGGWLMALTDAQQADLYQKVSDIWEQLRGPNGAGWPQLGQNASGANLTPVDAIAWIKTDLETNQPSGSGSGSGATSASPTT